MTAPAGWYPDAVGAPGAMRWWDGERWTERAERREVAPEVSPETGRQWTPPARPYRSGAYLVRLAIAMTVIVVLCQLAVVVSLPSSFERIREALARGEDTGSLTTTYDVFTTIGSGALLLAWPFNAGWLTRVRHNAEALAPEATHRRTGGWTWWAWIWPVVNLWFPYQVVRDVSGATRPRGRRLIGLWWSLFLAMTIYGWVYAGVSDSLWDADSMTWGRLVGINHGLEIGCLVITALAAVAWIAVAVRIEQDQVAAAARRAG